MGNLPAGELPLELALYEVRNKLLPMETCGFVRECATEICSTQPHPIACILIFSAIGSFIG
jgi:hypothetical protein